MKSESWRGVAQLRPTQTSAGLPQIVFEIHEERPFGWVAHCPQFGAYTAIVLNFCHTARSLWGRVYLCRQNGGNGANGRVIIKYPIFD